MASGDDDDDGSSSSSSDGGGDVGDGGDGGGGHTANTSEALINSCQWQIKSSRLHRNGETGTGADSASIH